MINKNIFREYDIRGKYPDDINELVAYKVGRSYATILVTKLKRNTCCIGMDNRHSSPALKKALVKGLMESGMNIIDLGLVTTPMFFYGCIHTNNLGIMITASHNPKDDNGFKFSFDNLGNARGEQVYKFRDFTLKDEFIEKEGSITEFNIYPYYKSLIRDNISMGNKRIKAVLDPGNGTTSIYVKDLYRQFPNLDLIVINGDSNPDFPNHHPDPAVEANLTQLINKVKEVKADIGIAYDGDGDRVGFVDDKGNIIAADKFLTILIRYLFPKLKDKRMLYDVKCSNIIPEEAKKMQGEAILYRTGASYTRAKINQDNIPFGGEYSGHICFNDKWPGFDSGLYAGLRMLEILSNVDKKASELLEGITNYYNTPEIKIPVKDEVKAQIVEDVKNYCLNKQYEINTIDGVKVFFPYGWALIRCSNTTPNLTVRFEAISEEQVTNLKKEFLEVINKFIQEKSL